MRIINQKIKDKDFLQKQELHNLFKQPKKDKGVNMPHFQNNEPNYIQQADLLFLPNDDGYKYALVVIDTSTRLLDAVPLKNKLAKNVKEGFETIYDRGIIKLPKFIETDPGTEFKGEVKTYFSKNGVHMKYGKPGRHRQQGIVESANKTIGKALSMRMTAQELLTNEQSNEWIDDLPLIITAMNKVAKKTKTY